MEKIIFIIDGKQYSLLKLRVTMFFTQFTHFAIEVIPVSVL